MSVSSVGESFEYVQLALVSCALFGEDLYFRPLFGRQIFRKFRLPIFKKNIV